MAVPSDRVSARQAFAAQLWAENPIFRQVLGICSTLAVTNRMFNTLLMCGGLIWATSLTSLTVSLLRNYTPFRVRMMVNILIAAVYVIVVDIALRAYFTEIHRDIAAYVGLIITNCIVLGRAEGFAIRNSPGASFADGAGAGLGYSAILIAVAAVREILGFGTFLGYAIPLGGTTLAGWMQAHNGQWVIMVMPPGAFFVLAAIVWICRGPLQRSAAGGAGRPAAQAVGAGGGR